jgi:nucleolin
MMETDESKSWRDSVLSVVEGTSEAIKLKKLRKQVLITLQLDESDKASKKTFKQTIQSLEETGELSLDADGLVTLTSKGKKRKPKKEKKDKKEKKKRKIEKSEHSTENEAELPQEDNSAQHADDSSTKEDEASPESGEDRNKPCKGNPQGATRIFCGNLPFTVDEASIGTFLKDKVTHIKWITDKETGKFYGSAFVEIQDSMAAAVAVAMAGQSLMGRPIKINFAPANPGDTWPPEKKVITGGAPATRAAGGTGVKAMSEKPENCLKLFIGNLSYEIDDDSIKKFFSNVDAEVKAVRWLSHKESGDFKGWYVVLDCTGQLF